MKIRLLRSCSGSDFSYAQGETAVVDPKVAEELISCGYAEEIPEPKVEIPDPPEIKDLPEIKEPEDKTKAPPELKGKKKTE